MPRVENMEEGKHLNSIRLQQELTEKNLRLEEAVDQVDRLQYKFDRQTHYLKTFFNINRELNTLRDMAGIMEKFLRLTLDSLGIEEGGIVLFSKEKQPLVTYRALGKKAVMNWSEEKLQALKTSLNGIIKESTQPYTESRSLTQEQLSAFKGSSGPPEIGFWFTLSESYFGLVVLGKKLTALKYALEEEEFLSNMVTNLAILLERAKSQERIQALLMDMEQRNIFIQKTAVDLNVSQSRVKVLEKARPQFRQAVKRGLEQSRRVSGLDILVIIGLGLALGVIFNLINPGGINPIPPSWLHKSPPPIDIQWAKPKYESGEALFVDARPDALFKQRHIKGAVNLPLDLFDFVYLMKFSHLDPEKELIVYGRNVSRHYDQEVALQLTSRGHAKVKVLSGGLPSWQDRGFPTEP